MKKLYIIGCGPGNDQLMTAFAKDIIAESDIILSTSNRLFKDKNIKSLALSDIYIELENNDKNVITILVSGDVNFHSCSSVISKKYKDKYAIYLLNGISSLQYFSTIVNEPYQNWKVISLHGQDISPIPKVSYNHKVFILTGGKNKVENIASSLYYAGLTDVNIFVGENLSMEDERIVKGSPKDIKDMSFKDLAVMLIHNENFQNPFVPLCDTDFIRGETPMTKEEIRWLSIKKLGILPNDIVYDIGAGTGSVSIEMARAAHNSFVYAFEMNHLAIDLLLKNKIKHGAANIHIICGEAPECLEKTPIPTKAFVGGSNGQIDDIINKLIDKNPNITVVCNAITLESLHETITSMEKHDFENIDVCCVNVAKAKNVGKYHMMMAQNPIYIIRGEHHG